MWNLTEGHAGEGLIESLGGTEFLHQIMHENRTTPKLVVYGLMNFLFCQSQFELDFRSLISPNSLQSYTLDFMLRSVDLIL